MAVTVRQNALRLGIAGARGESSADIARRTGLAANDSTDAEAVIALTVAATQELIDDGEIVGAVATPAAAAAMALPGAANKLPYYTGASTAALTDLSAFARTLLDDGDAATARVTLGADLAANVNFIDPGGGGSSGQVAVTLNAYLASLSVNVRAYGAVGDGAANDYSPVFQAMAAAYARGVPLYFPPGTYDVGQLNLPGPMVIFGDGIGVTTVKLRSGLSGSIFYIDGIDRCVVRDMTIDGNRANCPSGFAGVRLLNAAHDFTAMRVRTINCAASGIQGEGTGLRARLIDCESDNCAFGGGAFVGFPGGQIRGGSHIGNGRFGVYLGAGSDDWLVDTVATDNGTIIDSYTPFEGDGVEDTFAIAWGPAATDADVVVRVDGDFAVQGTDYTVNGPRTEVTFAAPPPNGAEIYVLLQSDIVANIAVFGDRCAVKGVAHRHLLGHGVQFNDATGGGVSDSVADENAISGFDRINSPDGYISNCRGDNNHYRAIEVDTASHRTKVTASGGTGNGDVDISVYASDDVSIISPIGDIRIWDGGQSGTLSENTLIVGGLSDTTVTVESGSSQGVQLYGFLGTVSDSGGEIAVAVGCPNFTIANQNLSLQNSWVVDTVASYFKSAEGVVHLFGRIKSGTVAANTVIATLPAGYRPATTEYFQVAASGAAANIYIEPDGEIRDLGGSMSATWTSLNGLYFRAA